MSKHSTGSSRERLAVHLAATEGESDNWNLPSGKTQSSVQGPQDVTLSPAELDVLSSVAARVLPGSPGAEGAHVRAYIQWLVRQDRFGPQLVGVKEGVARLNGLAEITLLKAFCECTLREQDQLLALVASGMHTGDRRFFVDLLNITLAGFLCPPEYGGNVGGVGWQFMGLPDDDC